MQFASLDEWQCRSQLIFPIVKDSLNFVFVPSFKRGDIAVGTDIDVVSMVFIYKLNKLTGLHTISINSQSQLRFETCGCCRIAKFIRRVGGIYFNYLTMFYLKITQ